MPNSVCQHRPRDLAPQSRNAGRVTETLRQSCKSSTPNPPSASVFPTTVDSAHATTMPAVQRTFELVPTTLIRSNGSKPPMTSKAAKKAYAKANAGPKISRAEQRKRDAAELERLKKEYEKERAAAKAKAAREKKAAKALEEKLERRKKGLPEPSKFVRASQPTISLFVRSNDNGSTKGKRSWQQISDIAERSDAEMSEMDNENECQEHPAKRVTIGSDCGPENRLEDNPSKKIIIADHGHEQDQKRTPARQIPIDQDRGTVNVADPIVQVPAVAEHESEDEFGEFPSLSQADILEKIASSTCSAGSIPSAQASALPRINRQQEVDTREPSPKPPQRIPIPDEDEYEDDMVSTQLFSEAMARAFKMDTCDVSRNDKQIVKDLGLEPRKVTLEDPPQSSIKFSKAEYIAVKRSPIQPLVDRRSTIEGRVNRKSSSPPRRPILESRSLNMLPPMRPIKRTKPTAFTSPALESQFPQNSATANSASSPLTPQPRFLLNERNSTPMPPPARRSRFLPPGQGPTHRPLPSAPPSATQAFLENHFDDFFPSPTQEIRELLDDADSLPTNTQIARDISPVRAVRQIEFDATSFFCSQDFILSSQDMREIGTPTSTPNPNPKTIKAQIITPKPESRPTSRKGRFFEEKEEDLRKSGIIEIAKPAGSKGSEPQTILSQASSLGDSPSIQAAIAESKELAEIRQLADASFNNFDEDIDFELVVRESEKLVVEKGSRDSSEEDIESLEAAIKDSKRLAGLELQRTADVPGPRRFFLEKDEDLVHESKKLEARPKQTVPSRDEARVKTRTLKRAESGLTDYGDDITSDDLTALFDA